MGLSEAFKIKALWLHFEESKKQDPALSLGDFLFMHYVVDDKNPNDNAEDKKLPFVNPISCFNWIGIDNSDSASEIAPLVVFSSTSYFHKNQNILASTSYLKHVWRPPKLS